MSTKTDTKVDELRAVIESAEVDALERMSQYRLSDAIREGASVTEQAVGGWGDGETACALHGAVIAAKAREWMV